HLILSSFPTRRSSDLQECRPPNRLMLYSTPDAKRKSSSASSSPIRRKHLPRLPGHPLHSSYTYRMVNIDSLPELASSESRLARLDRKSTRLNSSHDQI